jgi:hypothetical protein
MCHRNDFCQQIALAETVGDAMSGDFGLIKSNDAAATDAERCGTVFLSRSAIRDGNLWPKPGLRRSRQISHYRHGHRKKMAHQYVPEKCGGADTLKTEE